MEKRFLNRLTIVGIVDSNANKFITPSGSKGMALNLKVPNGRINN
jgi:hypothetical protein